MEIIIGMLFEMLCYLFVEGALEVIIRILTRPFSTHSEHPVILICGYFLLGLFVGGMSLLIFPHAFITETTFRYINLVLIPIFVALIMMTVGKLLAKKGKKLTSLDHFNYAFVFAFAMALVRFIFAK